MFKKVRVHQYCPDCKAYVPIPNKKELTSCPECHRFLSPCAVCEEAKDMDCDNCRYGYTGENMDSAAKPKNSDCEDAVQ